MRGNKKMHLKVKDTKKVMDIIGMIIIGAIITVLNLIVGANEKGLRIFPMCIMMIFVWCYLAIRRIVLKEKIVFKNRIDFFVLLFMCCTLLPYIFKTYCTLQGTVEFILKYFFVYAVYLLVRNVVDGKNKVNSLIWVTLASSIVIAVIGIDVQHGQYLNWLLDKLDLRYTECDALVSSFGYANAVAIYFSFCIFLAIHQIQNHKNKVVKIACALYIVLGFYIVLQTLCRAVFVLLMGALVVYFDLYFLPYLLKHKKQLGIVLGSGVVVGVLFLFFVFGIGIRVSKPYEFSDSQYQRNFNYPFKAKEEYTIELEIEAENQNGGLIEAGILEINTYFYEKMLVSKVLEPNKNKIVLKFKTTESLYQIDLLVSNEYEEKVSIKKCYINGEEYPMNYKFLPYQIGKAVAMYSANDKSIKQRTDMWKDCLKIAKDSPLIGQGGDTWKKLSQAVQDYPYGMKESHSYFFELLISYGIVGVIVYLVLMVGCNLMLIKEFIQKTECRKYKLAILFGLDLILVHSFCFDFDLSFLSVLMTVFVYIAVLLYDRREGVQKSEKTDYMVLGFLGVILVIFIMANMAQEFIKGEKLRKNVGFFNVDWRYNYITHRIETNQDFRGNLKELQVMMKKEPYFYQTETYDAYWYQLLNNLGSLNQYEIERYVSFMNKRYEKVKFVSPMYIETILPRVYTMKSVYLTLKNMNFTNRRLLDEIEKLNQRIETEYEINKVNIQEQERNGYDLETINEIMTEYENILNS